MRIKEFWTRGLIFAACARSRWSVAVPIRLPLAWPSAPRSETVLLGGRQQFAAHVTGSGTKLVTWQICLPPTTSATSPQFAIPRDRWTQLPNGYGTITSGQNGVGGGLYTAPTTPPPTNNFFVVATSTVDTTAFATAIVNVDSGIRVSVVPDTADLATGETFTFTANVVGTSNHGVTWEVSGSDGAPVVGGNSDLGFITASGVYTAPAVSPGSITITAVSSADSSRSGTSSVNVSSAANPVINSIKPNIVGEGSVQQDVYISGTGFFTTSTVLAGNPLEPVPSLFLSTTLIRATIPAGPLSASGPVPIVVQSAAGDNSNILPSNLGLTASPSRPSVVAAIPDTLSANLAGTNINLVGGFFSPSTTVQLNGTAASATITSSQQITVSAAGGALPAAGSYPLIVQNKDVVAPAPAISGVNIAVQPLASSIATGPQASIAVGASPQGIAIDPLSASPSSPMPARTPSPSSISPPIRPSLARLSP